MITFACEKGEWPIEDLKAFSINAGVRVIIRDYGVIENGRLFLYA